MEKDPPPAAAPRSNTSQRAARATAAPRSVEPRSVEPRSATRARLAASAGEAKSEVQPRAARQTRQRQPPESRAEILERLSNPLVSLHEAGVLLRVCSATVRRLSNQGELPHHRTEGGQRRFRLRDVLRVLEERERREKLRSSSYRPFARPPGAPHDAARGPVSSQAPANPLARRDLRPQMRPEPPRPRDPRELLAATHARAQAAWLQAQAAAQGSAPKRAVASAQLEAPLKNANSGHETPRPRSPLKLGASRVPEPKAQATSEGAAPEPGARPGGEASPAKGKGAGAS